MDSFLKLYSYPGSGASTQDAKASLLLLMDVWQEQSIIY